MTEDEIEKLRQEKQKELQEELEDKQKQQEEQLKKQQLQKILEPEARARLSRLKLVKENKAEKIENLLISQSKQIQGKITDEQLKSIIKEINKQTKKQDYNIKSRSL